MAESYSLEAVLSVVDQGFTQAMERAGNATESLSSKAKSSSAGIGAMSLAFGAAQLGVKAFTAALGMVTGSIDGAVNRIDTLNNSERVFKNMGFEAGETAKMMDNLNDSITGLPTPLDSAVKGVQLIASSTNDLLKSEQIFSAMNNAILGFGGSADMVDNAIVQLSQSFSNGKIDAQTWNSMINSGMGPSLTALAKTMNMTMGEFKAGLSDGTISVEEFQDALITLNEEGGGGLASLQQIAQDATGGIKTSLANMRTAIVRGVANIISSIDEGLAGAGLMTIGEMISAFGKAMNTALTQVGNVLGVVIPKAVAFISMLVGPLQEVTGLFGALTPSAEAAGAAIEQVAMSAEELSAIADSWNDLSLDEKQATVDTMGQEDLEKLMELLGVDFDSIPDEYTKNAFLNAHGADALEELLWVTGTWHDLTLEEKRAVLEAQIDNEELAQAIETMGMWEDAEFYSKLADINMNDNGAEQQVLDLINQWAELNGLEPVEIEVNAETKTAEKELTNFSKNFNRFSKTFGKIVGHLQKVGEAMFDFAEPAFDFMSDLMDLGLDAFEGYFTAFEKLVDGDWQGAWDTFKNTTTDAIGNVVGSLKTNIPRMWDNIKGAASGLWQAFRGIDWGVVLSEINSFFSGIAGHITSIDWYAVGAAVSGTIADLGIAIKAYIDTTFGDGKLGKMITEAIKEMFTPDSNLNAEAGKFTRAVMDLLDGIADGISQAIGGFNITDVADEWKTKVTGFFDGLKTTWENLVDTDWSTSFEMGTVLEGIKAAFSEGFANFEFGEIEFEWPEINWGSWAPLVEQFKSEVEAVKNAIVEIFSSISLSDIMPNIEFKVPFGDLFKLDWETGSWEKVEVEIDVEATPNVDVKEDEGWLETLKGFFSSATPTEVEAPVNIRPVVAMSGGSGSGALTGSVGGGLSSGGLADGILGQLATEIQTAMASANAAASSGMSTITQTVNSGANNIKTVFTQLGTSLNQAMTQAMSNVVSTTTSGMASVVSALNSAAGAARSAGRNLGMGFHAGLASTMGSIIALASSIASAAAGAIKAGLDIHSPSRVGFYLFKMLGQGLFDGLKSMVKPLSALYSDIVDIVSLDDQNVRFDFDTNVVKPNLDTWSLSGLNHPNVSNTSQISLDTSRLEAKLDQLLAKDANTYIDRDLWVGGTSDAYDRRFGQDYNEYSGRLLI